MKKKLIILSASPSFNIIFRKTIYLFFLFIFLAGCKGKGDKEIPENAISPTVIENPATASGSNKNDNAPVFKFEKDSHDFGTITEGEKVTYAFRFTNTGKSDLVIRAAQGSCGCTVPEFPKEPVKPGEGGIITVTFDSKGRSGDQYKTVDVISNTIPNVYKLSISCKVKAEEK